MICRWVGPRLDGFALVWYRLGFGLWHTLISGLPVCRDVHCGGPRFGTSCCLDRHRDRGGHCDIFYLGGIEWQHQACTLVEILRLGGFQSSVLIPVWATPKLEAQRDSGVEQMGELAQTPVNQDVECFNLPAWVAHRRSGTETCQSGRPVYDCKNDPQSNP